MRISDQTLNRLRVLKAIRSGAPITRSELPNATGLSAGTISQLTSDVVKRGLIVERRDTAKRLGRPRIYLEFATKGAVVLGASITGNNVLTAAFVNLAGNQLHAAEIRFEAPTTLGDLALQIAVSLEAVIAQSPFEKGEIIRLGIALPGVIDSRRGIVRFMTTFEVADSPFAQIIEDQVGLPVIIENDPACMSRAEHWFGGATDLDTFTMVHVGPAVVSAEYAEGVPKVNQRGVNAELGHVKVEYGPDARPCFCGARGCLTMYSSMYGLLLQADRLGDAPFPPIKTIDERFSRLLDEAAVPKSAAALYVEEAAIYLGRALANHVNATDPGTVLVSALDSRFLDLIRDPVLDVMRECVMPGVFETLDVRFIVTDPDWRHSGTAALALEYAYLELN